MLTKRDNRLCTSYTHSAATSGCAVDNLYPFDAQMHTFMRIKLYANSYEVMVSPPYSAVDIRCYPLKREISWSIRCSKDEVVVSMP